MNIAEALIQCFYGYETDALTGKKTEFNIPIELHKLNENLSELIYILKEKDEV